MSTLQQRLERTLVRPIPLGGCKSLHLSIKNVLREIPYSQEDKIHADIFCVIIVRKENEGNFARRFHLFLLVFTSTEGMAHRSQLHYRL